MTIKSQKPVVANCERVISTDTVSNERVRALLTKVIIFIITKPNQN